MGKALMVLLSCPKDSRQNVAFFKLLKEWIVVKLPRICISIQTTYNPGGCRFKSPRCHCRFKGFLDLHKAYLKHGMFGSWIRNDFGVRTYILKIFNSFGHWNLFYSIQPYRVSLSGHSFLPHLWSWSTHDLLVWAQTRMLKRKHIILLSFLTWSC